MSPDRYLQFAAILVSYFMKVAAAYLLCWLLARLLASPRQKFRLWMAFMFGSAAYWLYLIVSFSIAFVALPAPGLNHVVSRTYHEFLIPMRFEHATMIGGRSLVCAYLLGVLLLVSTGIWKRIKLHFLLRQGGAPAVELQHLFAQMCRHFRVRHCELLVLPKVSSPATVCWWRPRILLPRICEQLEDNRLMADILYHELAHVARRDYLWTSVNDVICRLLFFHPAVWQARGQISVYREMACDLAVVAARPEHRADYAQTLTQVARLCLVRKSSVIGVDFAAGPSLLAHRVHAILNDPESSSFPQRLFRLAAGLALVGAYAFLCSAMAVAIAFASPNSTPAVAEIQPALQASARRPSKHKIRKEPVPGETGESLITESPAYRLTAAPDANEYAPERSSSGDPGDADSNLPRWMAPASSGHTRSAGTTVGSIIAATVGTVITDKDDRSKHKDSTHVQSSTSSNPH